MARAKPVTEKRAPTARRAKSRDATAPDSVRTRQDADCRKRSILDAARPLFLARSYDEVNTEEIAKAAGLSKGLLFFYFGSKRGLFVELVKVAAAELLAATWIPEQHPALDRLRLALQAYVRYVRKNRVAYEWLMSGGTATAPELRRLVDETRAQLAARLVLGTGEHSLVAAKGFIGFVEASMLEHLRTRAGDDALVALWIEVLSTALRSPPPT